MHVLAFEPFDAGSHRAVRESISRHSAHSWTWLTRPGKSWKWRMRTAAIEFAAMVRERMVTPPAPDSGAGGNTAIEVASKAPKAFVTSSASNLGAANRTYTAPDLEAAREPAIVASDVDVLFVTSLMSASDLMALLPREFRSKPLVFYMHENQTAYPAGDAGDDPRDLHFLLTNIVSAAAADCVIFNSEWNRRSFLEGSTTLLARHRDRRLRDVLPRIEKKSLVIWPPVEVPDVSRNALTPLSVGRGVGGEGAAGDSIHLLQNTPNNPHPSPLPPPDRGEGVRRVLHNLRDDGATRVVWPHRWEHDKGPAELLEIARQFSESHNLRWIILGERYPRVPSELETFQEEFADRIDQFGYVEDRDTYWRWLSQAEWVLSTAKHEFFGIAVVEALLAGGGGAGALPWLPGRLSYEETLPACAKGLSPMNPPRDADAVRAAIRKHLEPAIAVNAVRRIDGVVDGAR